MRSILKASTLESDRDVGVLADDAAVFHRHDGELAFQCGCF